MNNKKVLPVTSGFTSGGYNLKFRASTGIQQQIVKTILIWDRPMVTVTQLIDEMLRFVNSICSVASPSDHFRSSTRMEKYLGSSLFDFFKIHRGWKSSSIKTGSVRKSSRFELVPSGSNDSDFSTTRISPQLHTFQPISSQLWVICMSHDSRLTKLTFCSVIQTIDYLMLT